mmetsp:Transcript_16068/g.15790  ORF Transcript_16068/g.15790 Transcript_16068/m.15790 type:complete len:113 (+) Transcript_16068:2-340(+)
MNYEEILQQKYDQYYEQHHRGYFDGAEEEGVETEEEISPAMLEDNEDELIRIIMKRFVDGELDKFVNYQDIDSSTKYDNYKQIQIDQEDLYFDSEEASEAPKDSVYTGEQDF